ncbi:MAG: nucleotide-binding protein, partial [Planctomycetaceae bacterium]|nr:nucleotide-binding protein [Planctomycetaceae bacterium]
MATRTVPLVALADMAPGQEADLFALLSAKQELLTREGKKYHRVTFRDARREVSFPVWTESIWADECQRQWTPGLFYKLRALYRETSYGPQLEIFKIREATEADRADGFDPSMCQAHSRFDPVQMFRELVALADEWI